MRRPALAFALALAVTPAAASDEADVLAIEHQFTDSMNNSDTKTALAACATPSSIIDEFPPYRWQGATACADWAKDFAAFNKTNAITDPVGG